MHSQNPSKVDRIDGDGERELGVEKRGRGDEGTRGRGDEGKRGRAMVASGKTPIPQYQPNLSGNKAIIRGISYFFLFAY